MPKIIEFITDGALIGGVRNWVWLAGLAIIAAFAFMVIEIADNRDKRMIQTAEESGASASVIEGQNQTLDQLGDANNAEQEIRNAGERSAARYDDCMRNSRRPAGCERYRPQPE